MRSRFRDIVVQVEFQRTDHKVAMLVKCVVFMVFQIDPVTRHERCSDDESDSYPWIGYHLSSIRRGACLALESWINPCGMPV